MKGVDYRKTIERLGITQVEAARFLGVDDTTSRRWIADKQRIPRSTAMLLHLMLRYRLSPDHVLAVMQRKLRT